MPLEDSECDRKRCRFLCVPALRKKKRAALQKNEYIAYEPEAFLSDFSDRSASANGEASAAAVRTKPELSGLCEAETAACVHTAWPSAAGGDSGVGVFRGRAVAGPRDKVDKTGWRGPWPEEAMDGPVVVRSERTRLEYRRVSGKGFEQGAPRSVCPGAVFRAGCSCGRSTVLPEPYRASFWKSSGK